MLWIEITEQDILLQTDVVVRKLEELKKQGHKLLIDDFGMGTYFPAVPAVRVF